MKKIIISSDSTSDLGEELINKYDIQIIPLYVNLDGKEYKDGVDMNPDMIYAYHDEHGVLPTTSAPNVNDFIKHFEKWNSDEYDVIHFSIGSSLSSSYQNSFIASQNFDNVYCIDSCNLSTGIGIMIIEACRLRDEGLSTKEIYDRIIELRPKINTSFVVDSLLYLKEGGRASALQAMGANLLNIKPSIVVINEKQGAMEIGTKYRGNTKKVLTKYIKDLLENNDNIANDVAFITHSGTSDENLEFVRAEVAKYKKFENLYITRAGSTISSHCGYNTIGVITKSIN